MEKFQVNETNCWVWNATSGMNGRQEVGYFWYRGRMEQAHKVAWLLFCGEIPDGYYAARVCNNGLCVNPAHMALLPIQSWIHRSDRKLTEEQVSEIRESAESEYTLAERYGVSHQAIHAIRKFKSYKDVL